MLSTSLFVIGLAAAYNSLQCFIPAMNVTKKIYANSKDQVSPLASRLMGTWTITSAIIRIYTSYNINDHSAYLLCLVTFVIAFLNFMSEVFVYKTAPLSSPGVWPALMVKFDDDLPLQTLIVRTCLLRLLGIIYPYCMDAFFI